MADEAPRILPGYEALKRATQSNMRDLVRLKEQLASMERRLAMLEARRGPGRPRKGEAG